jgi:hypothetical protein
MFGSLLSRVAARTRWTTAAALGVTCSLGAWYADHRRANAAWSSPIEPPETMPDSCPRPAKSMGKPKVVPRMTLAQMRQMVADGRMVVAYRGDLYDMTDCAL